LSYGQPIRGYTNRKLELSTGVWSTVDSDLLRAGMSQAIDRPRRLSTTFWVLGVSELVSESVPNQIMSFWVLFLRGLCGYMKRGIVPIKV